ncbi:MAG: sulfite exporter TauE/SafE family protein [Hyphomicrobiaceae bacterium]
MPTPLADLAILAVAVAAGATMQAATGFGFAILSAPVFLAVLNSTSAVPILVALHVVQCIVLVPRIWNGIPWSHLYRLAVGALVGCPIGLVLFRSLDVRQLKLGVGLVILLVLALMAWRRSHGATAVQAHEATGRHPASTASEVVTGSLSGALTAVLVMPGPPLMLHLLRHPMPATNARSLSIAFFAACYAAVMTVHALSGALTSSSAALIAWLAAPVLAGTYAGLHSTRWISDRHFAPILYLLLLAAGLGAITSAF